MAILGAAAGLDITQKLHEVRFLSGTRAQYHDDVLGGKCRIGGTEIDAGGERGMDLAFELDALRINDPPRDSLNRSRRLSAGGQRCRHGENQADHRPPTQRCANTTTGHRDTPWPGVRMS